MANVNNEAFVNYLAGQDKARRRRVDAVLDAMTKRERQLVIEVMVMTNVRARMLAQIPGKPEPASQLLYDTIYACLSIGDDLYPTLDRLERIATRRARRLKEET